MAAVNLLKEIEHLLLLKPATITFGIHEDKGSRVHEGDGPTVAEIATVHEYGLGVPRRSIVADFVDDRAEDINATVDKTLTKIAEGAPVTLDAIPLILAGKMRARFAEGIGPVLDPRTIARKGSSLQLVDTGLLRSSIDGKIEYNG